MAGRVLTSENCCLPRDETRFKTGDVILGHSSRSEATLECRTDPCPVEGSEFPYRTHCFRFVVDDKARHAVFDYFGDGPSSPRNNWRPHAMASIMTKPKGSGQSIGKRRAEAFPRNSFFCFSFTSPTN
jgi:hypothetical protein